MIITLTFNNSIFTFVSIYEIIDINNRTNGKRIQNQINEGLIIGIFIYVFKLIPFS